MLESKATGLILILEDVLSHPKACSVLFQAFKTTMTWMKIF